MLKRFLTTLAFSWLASPLGVLAVHAMGMAAHPVLILVLLASSAASPFQILLNEAYAARQAAGVAKPGAALLSVVLLTQSATCAATLGLASTQAFSAGLIIVAVSITCASALLSYSATVTFYVMAMHNRLSGRQAALFGALPGLTTLVLYLTAGALAEAAPVVAQWLFLAVAVAPTGVVWLFMKAISADHTSVKPQGGGAARRAASLGVMLMALLSLALCGSLLRDRVAQLSNAYAALIIVALNLFASMMMTLTRATFLRHAGTPASPLVPLFATACVLAGMWLSLDGARWGDLLLLAGCQALIVCMVEIGRRSGSGHPAERSLATP